MLQQDTPDDYVLATGCSWTIAEFLDRAFGRLGLDWRKHVEFDPRYLRPSEAPALEGDASKASRLLGWRPKTDFDTLVCMMVDHDLQLAEQEKAAGDRLGDG